MSMSEDRDLRDLLPNRAGDEARRERRSRAEIDRLQARVAELEDHKAMLNTCIDGTKQRITALEAEIGFLREQNQTLRESANHCASCGLLLPYHAKECGRWELVVRDLEAERDQLRAAAAQYHARTSVVFKRGSRADLMLMFESEQRLLGILDALRASGESATELPTGEREKSS